MATEASRAHVLATTALTAALAALFSHPARALGWDLAANVSATTTVTDNGRQQAGNSGGTSSIVSVRPSISATSSGSDRLRVSASYALDASERFGDDTGNFNGNDNRDRLRHSLDSTLDAEIVEDFFFIDASARVSQQLVSLLSAPTTDRSDRGSQTTVGSYTVTPSLVQRFGRFATGSLRYTLGGTVFRDTTLGNDADSGVIDASLVSGPRFGDLDGSLRYTRRDVRNRRNANFASQDLTYERLTASVGYALTRKFRVYATVGEDRNDFQETSNIDGTSYSAGFTWAPNQRTRLDLSAGERFFGKTFSASGAYSTPRTSWSLSYIEDVSDVTQQLQGPLVAWACPVGGLVVLSPTRPNDTCSENPLTFDELLRARDEGRIDFDNFGLARGIFVLKALSAGVGWTLTPRLSVAFDASESRRRYLVQDSREDLIRRLGVSSTYRLAGMTTLTGSLSFSQTEVPPGLPGLDNLTARSDDLVSVGASLAHSFGRDLRGTLSLRHTQRDSNDADASYDENSLTASITYTF